MYFRSCRDVMPHHESRLSPPENAVRIAKMLMVYQFIYYNAVVPSQKLTNIIRYLGISSITIIRVRVLATVNFTDLSYSMIWVALWIRFPVLAPYSTQPSTGPVPSKNITAKWVHDIDEMDSEFPLTQLDQSQDGHLQ
ncbi:hypothetical protein N7516_002849 [Penicillium verrucosum]|uniref:uncharacterized protein n=1 Tax=Penicillium verrucosum TaxID=60171 RepID=UPI002545B96D|nr:uncharacterized protein N7516_002849 [Penicillium verrucosum]KAJ5942681.1 hypothetical protein N7516_002849 [Penicillium verrucosum]